MIYEKVDESGFFFFSFFFFGFFFGGGGEACGFFSISFLLLFLHL